MEPKIGPHGHPDWDSLRENQYPQGNDLIEQTEHPTVGGETMGEHPLGGPPEGSHANPPSPPALSGRPPQFTMKQLADSSHFMAPTHKPAEQAIDSCSCRDCRWYRLADVSILTNLQAEAHLVELHQQKKLTTEQLVMGKRTLFWWIPF